MKTIDYHHHIIPQAVVDILPAQRKPAKAWSPEVSLKYMEKNKIDTAVLSLYVKGLGTLEKELQLKIVRAFNDAAAAVKKQYPDRFKVLAAVPFSFIAESVAEIKYALDTLKFDGVSLTPITDNMQLDDSASAPVLEALNNRAAFTMLHPDDAEGIPVENEHYLDAVLAFTRLMHYDRLKKYPHIRFCLAHTGGIIPFLAENMGLLAYFQVQRNRVGKFLWDYLIKKRLKGDVQLKSLCIDTADIGTDDSLESQREYFNPGNLRWGTNSLNCA